MTMVSNDAAGAEPTGADLRVFRSAGEMAIGLPLAAAAVAALSLALLPHAPAELKAPVQTAARAVRPLIPAERLADSSAASLDAAVDSRAVVRSLLKQAGLRPSLDLHRLSWDQARKVNALLPTNRAPTGVAEPFRLDTATPNGRQALKCLTQAAYFEAGANGPVAEAAVVQVVLNRLRHPDFPKSVCGVVYQGSDDEGCQFSFTCDGALARPIDVSAWNEARKVARRALGGYVVRAVGTATYYHADYVFPAWATSLVKMATVGPHIFYRMAGPAGAAAYFNGRYAGNELKLTRAILRAGQKPKQKAQVQLAAGDSEKAAVPAGLKVQAERLQRVHTVLAAEPQLQSAKPEPAKVETASIQPSAEGPALTAAPALAPPAPTPTAAVETTPAA
jgi:spore germination cell wall hydrolase CwlJ-like protein